MAPFVELEWGADAYALMHAIKRLFDPDGLLNPGVVLSDDADAHVRNLKPLPACDALVDKCIECGFCEPKCPSRGLTLSPRQRIVGWREIARRAALGDTAPSLRAAYDYAGIDTCAACGLCATACPVGIETGLLIKSLRGRRAGPVARGVAGAVAGHFALATAGVRAGLGAADLAHRALGTRAMDSALAGLRAATGGAVPKWSPALPRPVRFKPPARLARRRGRRCDRLFPELRRAQHGRAARAGRRRPAPGDGRAALRQGGLRRRLSGAAVGNCAAASRSRARG